MLSQRQIERLVHAGAYRRLSRRILANGRCQDARIIERLLEPRAVAPAALGLALQRLLELSWGPSVEAQRMVQRLLACQRADGLFARPADVESDQDACGGEKPAGDEGDTRTDNGGTSLEGAAGRTDVFQEVENTRRLVAGDGGRGAADVDARWPRSEAGTIAATAVAIAGLWHWLARSGANDPQAPRELVKRAQTALDAAVGALQRAIETGAETRRGRDALASIDAAIILWQLAGIEELETRLDLDQLADRLRRDADLAGLGALFRDAYHSAA